jgi:hypothetical protein
MARVNRLDADDEPIRQLRRRGASAVRCKRETATHAPESRRAGARGALRRCGCSGYAPSSRVPLNTRQRRPPRRISAPQRLRRTRKQRARVVDGPGTRAAPSRAPPAESRTQSPTCRSRLTAGPPARRPGGGPKSGLPKLLRAWPTRAHPVRAAGRRKGSGERLRSCRCGSWSQRRARRAARHAGGRRTRVLHPSLRRAQVLWRARSAAAWHTAAPHGAHREERAGHGQRRALRWRRQVSKARGGAVAARRLQRLQEAAARRDRRRGGRPPRRLPRERRHLRAAAAARGARAGEEQRHRLAARRASHGSPRPRHRVGRAVTL